MAAADSPSRTLSDNLRLSQTIYCNLKFLETDIMTLSSEEVVLSLMFYICGQIIGRLPTITTCQSFHPESTNEQVLSKEMGGVDTPTVQTGAFIGLVWSCGALFLVLFVC